MPVKPVPDGYHTVTPYLIVNNGNRALEFYKNAFGAVEVMRMPGPNNTVGHAEIKIGDSPIMLADECPEMGFASAETLGGAAVSILLYLPDVDQRVAKAIAAGATVVRPLQNQFYGDRSATLKDPFGHVWTIATHVEDVPPDEMERRAAKMAEEFAKQQKKK